MISDFPVSFRVLYLWPASCMFTQHSLAVVRTFSLLQAQGAREVITMVGKMEIMYILYRSQGGMCSYPHFPYACQETFLKRHVETEGLSLYDCGRTA